MRIILMINTKSPNVNMVMGIVSIINIGLTKAFKKPSTTATTMAVKLSLTVTPFNNKAANKIATVVASVLVKNAFIIILR
jgi:hypothetical protein